MKVADLYAALQIKPDARTLKASDAFLARATKRVDAFAKKANERLGRALNWGAALGTGAFVLAAKDALAFDKAITALNVSADGAMGTVDEMKTSFLGMSKATGVAKEELVAAAQAYVAATGDGEGATEAVKTFARVAVASSSSIEDISNAAAALQEQFSITPGEMEQAFSILIAGGKAGKIELKDMADLTASLAAKFKRFGDSGGLGGAATFSSLFQVVAKDAGNAREAATNLENVLSKIAGREFELAKIGIKLRKGGKAGKGEFKDIRSILGLLKTVMDKNPEEFFKAFGNDIQAKAGLLALTDRLDVVDELTKKTRESTVVATDLAKVQQSASFRAQAAWVRLKDKIAEAFTPERIDQLASAVEKIIGAVFRFIDALGGVENAVWAVIAAWGALKAFQVAGLLTNIIKSMWSLTAATTAAAQAGGGLGGALGRLGLVAAAGAGGYALGNVISHKLGLHEGDAGYNNDYIDPLYAAQKKKNKAAREARAAAAAEAAARSGDNTTLNIYAPTTDARQLARETVREMNANERRKAMTR